MASDKPDYRVPSPAEKYRPGDAYYYYCQGNSNFLPDLNQNDNRVKMNNIPDYEEPFLRFDVDRPEFLFGLDMNNNFWVDQYENDAAPDYPYRKDHKGYNIYGGAHLLNGMRPVSYTHLTLPTNREV